MSTKIRLVALVGVVAVAVLALASLPAVAEADISKTAPRLNHPGHGDGAILTLDRDQGGDYATPQPVVPPKDVKPGLAGAPATPGAIADGAATASFGASIVGGGGGRISSKSERVERSLRTTADKLR